MNEKHHDSLVQYVNDVIGMERDIINAIRGQLKDDRVTGHVDLKILLDDVVTQGEARLQRFKELSEAEGGSFGEALKEGITAVTGVLAGIYGRLREHPVSRMLRDDIIAMDVATTSYGMLLTLALATGHSQCAALAEAGLRACAPLVVKLTDQLPLVVAGELANDAPLSNPAAAQVAHKTIREAWRHRS